MVLLQPDRFLNELTSLYEKHTESGSVWVTMKHSCMKHKVTRVKLEKQGEEFEYKCLIRATDGKKRISTLISAKDQLKFQSSYATVLKAHMDALKKKAKKEKKKTEPDKKQTDPAKKKASVKKSAPPVAKS
ncbi:hypothetical protein LUZ60_009087 [Juncus effusus]|nr:hypothetical protein LUZ60_009087 [Juncus effusus]